MNLSIQRKTSQHPCFNPDAHQYARIHLPVAPKCNISCNYCSRRFDCANESRPGVTSQLLTPSEAFDTYKNAKAKLPNLKVVGIAGPGDALANWEETKLTLQMIREFDPEVTFCLSTNGLMLPYYGKDLIELGVTHITITINAVDPAIGAKVYKKVNYKGETYSGVQAAEILINNQFNGLAFMTHHGIVCKVNIVMIKDVNEKQIRGIVSKAESHGAFMTNIMKMIPVPGSIFESLESVSQDQLNLTRKTCEGTLKQMYHCKQCRADAVGLLGQDQQCKNFACKAN